MSNELHKYLISSSSYYIHISGSLNIGRHGSGQIGPQNIIYIVEYNQRSYFITLSMGNGGSTPSTGHSPVRNDGSSPHGLGTKYLTIQEAADVLGAEKFASIRRMAMNFAINDFLDIGVFSLMLQMKLDRMVPS